MDTRKKDEKPHFTEVFPSGASASNRSQTTDNRIMVFYQGMRIYIPDQVQTETLSRVLQVLKQL